MASFTTFAERSHIFARIGLAYALMALLFALGVIAIPFPLAGALKAPLFIIGIYYWAIYRPDLLPVWLVFVAGLAMDLLSGLPVGINALVFVSVRWVVSRQRRFLTGQSFMMIWMGFGVVALASALAQWAIFGLTQLHWPPVYMTLVSAFFGVSLFPVICVILHMIHKILPMPRSVLRSRASS